ncbi:hypothetical protein QTP70_035264, partial [Hemibagrus guttatus]
QPDVYPGKCWGFRGSEGHLVISLLNPIRITHVTLQHLPRVLSPGQHIMSAPKDFIVYGLESMTTERKYLGIFTYDPNREPIQTFKLLPDVYPGKCWGFRGSEGHLVISLLNPIRITHVTLQHLSRVLSPGQYIMSAPKDFIVYEFFFEAHQG